MKIVIVGAGPGGSTAAMLLAQQRRHEIVLVDRDQFPRMKTCGSGLGPRCVTLCKELGLYDQMQGMALGIRGCRFVAPSGQEAILASNTEAAWIIPRATFDAEIAFTAEREGARKHRQPLREARGLWRNGVAEEGQPRLIRFGLLIELRSARCGALEFLASDPHIDHQLAGFGDLATLREHFLLLGVEHRPY